MKKDIETILERMGEHARSVKLSSFDKNRIQERIVQRVGGLSEESVQEKIQSPFSIVSQWSHLVARRGVVYVSATFAIVLLVSGGVVAAAEQALPGDLLYPVKTNVTEGVIGIFSTSPEEKADLQARLASRRLGEVTQLALSGRLTSESRAQLEQEVTKHIAQIDTQVAALKAQNNFKDAIEVSSRLEVSLRDNVRALGEIDGTVNTETTAVAVAVSEKADAALLTRIELEGEAHPDIAQVGVMTLAIEKRAEIEEVSVASDELFVKIIAVAGEEAVAELDAAKITIEELISAGDALFDQGDYKSAYLTYQKALRQFVEFEAMLNSHSGLLSEASLEESGEELGIDASEDDGEALDIDAALDATL